MGLSIEELRTRIEDLQNAGMDLAARALQRELHNRLKRD